MRGYAQTVSILRGARARLAACALLATAAVLAVMLGIPPQAAFGADADAAAGHPGARVYTLGADDGALEALDDNGSYASPYALLKSDGYLYRCDSKGNAYKDGTLWAYAPGAYQWNESLIANFGKIDTLFIAPDVKTLTSGTPFKVRFRYNAGQAPRELSFELGSYVPPRLTNVRTIVFQTGANGCSACTLIGDHAFYSLPNLVTVKNLEKTRVTSIGDWAFAGCSSLARIKLPATLAKLGNLCFDGCSSLESIGFPRGLSVMGRGCFSGCLSLQSAELPEGFSGIGANGFRDCTRLAKVDLPASLGSIPDSAFAGCSQLRSVTIRAKSMVGLGWEPFEGTPLVEDRANGAWFHVPQNALKTYRSAWSGKAYRHHLKAMTSQKWTRLAGANRFATMSAVVSTAFPSRSTWAIVATGEQFPDALAASALAGAYQCPIVLTAGSSLPVEARRQLDRMGVSNVIVLGGTSSVSASAERSIRSLGCSVTRIAGADRMDTSVKIFRAFQKKKGSRGYDTVIVASGISFADALSASPYAYAKAAPIVLAGPGGLTADAAKAIKSDPCIRKVVIVGGYGSVPARVESQLSGKSISRIAGTDRFATSRKIADWSLKRGMKASNLAVATGLDFPDALAGSALCGRQGSVLLLASSGHSSQAVAFCRAHGSQIKKAFILGGEASVPGSIYTALAGATG